MRIRRNLLWTGFVVAGLLPGTLWTWNALAEPPVPPIHLPEAFRPAPHQQEALQALQQIEQEREQRLREVRELDENAARIREQLMRDRAAEHAPPRGEAPRPAEIVELLHLMRNEIRQLREEVHALRAQLGGKEHSQAKSPFETHAAELKAQREKIERAAAELRKQIELERQKVLEHPQQKEKIERQLRQQPSVESRLKQKLLELEQSLERNPANKIQLEFELEKKLKSLKPELDTDFEKLPSGKVQEEFDSDFKQIESKNTAAEPGTERENLEQPVEKLIEKPETRE